jgi:solute carrier family 35 protein F1/2
LEKWQEISLVIGFSMCLLLVYITMPLVLQVSNATAVNISILSSDFYSLIIGIYLFRFKFHWLYFVSFALVIIGFIVYFLEPTPNHSTQDTNETNIPINGNYDLDYNTGITSSSTLNSSSTYNAFNSQFNIQSMNDMQNSYLTAVNIHSNHEFDQKSMT